MFEKTFLAITAIFMASTMVKALIPCPKDCPTPGNCVVLSESDCQSKGGYIKNNATSCGCCPACLLRVGSDCLISNIMGGPASTEFCDEGLVCEGNEQSNVFEEGTCVK